MEPRRRVDWILLGALAVVAGGVLLRVFALDSDPTYPFWSGWVTDEGRWTELAREWALWRAPDFDSPVSLTHFVLAPVFQALAAASFGVFGVSAVTARLVSVLAGLGILMVLGVFLRPRLSRGAWLCALALLAVQPDLVYFSRVAIPEMAALFFEVLAFTLIVGGPRTVRRAVLGGVATALALGVKGTTMPIVPVFAVVLWFVHTPGDPARRLARIGGYLGAIVVPGLLFAFAAAIATGGFGFLSSAGGPADILGFVTLNSAYTMVATLYEGGLTIRVNLGLAAIWALAVAGIARPFPRSDDEAVFLGALIWLVGWIVPWIFLEYFPERYVAHVHLPLILALCAGLSVMSREGRGAPFHRLDAAPKWKRVVLLPVLMVPLGALLTPAVVSGVDLFGPLLENLRFRLATVLGVAGVTGGLLAWFWRPDRVVVFAVSMPLTIAATWLLARTLGWMPSSFWAIDGNATFGAWLAVLAVSAVIVGGIRRARAATGSEVAFWLSHYGALLALVWLGTGIQRLAERTYVLRDVADHLAATYPQGTLIMSEEGTSVFLDLPFRYHEMTGGVDDWEHPTVFVALERQGLGEFWRSMEDYTVTGEFVLEMGRDYEDPLFGGEVIRVYERVDTSAAGRAAVGTSPTSVTTGNP